MRIDYVVLICDGCQLAKRHDIEPPLLGAIQLRHWFSQHAKPCERCGGASWKIRSHVIGKDDIPL